MSVPGYSCLVRKSGTSTGVTAEPITALSSTVFRITDSAKRVVDPQTAFHLLNSATTVAYTAMSGVNFVFGEFTLAAPVADGSATSLTFNGSYLPISTSSDTVLDTKSFKLGEECSLLDTTVFSGSSTDVIRRRIPSLRDVSLEVESIAAQADLSTLQTVMDNGTLVVTEVFFGQAAIPRFRGICFIENIDRSDSVEGLVSTNIAFKISDTPNTVSGFHATYGFKTLT